MPDMTQSDMNKMLDLMARFSVHFEQLADKQEFERNDAKSKILIQAYNMMMDSNTDPAHKMY